MQTLSKTELEWTMTALKSYLRTLEAEPNSSIKELIVGNYTELLDKYRKIQHGNDKRITVLR